MYARVSLTRKDGHYWPLNLNMGAIGFDEAYRRLESFNHGIILVSNCHITMEGFFITAEPDKEYHNIWEPSLLKETLRNFLEGK